MFNKIIHLTLRIHYHSFKLELNNLFIQLLYKLMIRSAIVQISNADTVRASRRDLALLHQQSKLPALEACIFAAEHKRQSSGDSFLFFFSIKTQLALSTNTMIYAKTVETAPPQKQSTATTKQLLKPWKQRRILGSFICIHQDPFCVNISSTGGICMQIQIANKKLWQKDEHIAESYENMDQLKCASYGRIEADACIKVPVEAE